MSIKQRIEKDAARLMADHAEARRIVKPDAPAEVDTELNAALEQVAAGKLATAYRTRNGSLVTTRAPGGKLHALQRDSKDAGFDFDE